MVQERGCKVHQPVVREDRGGVGGREGGREEGGVRGGGGVEGTSV